MATTRAWARVGVLGGLLLAASAAGGVAAQKPACDERAGTLGIQGLRCEGCSYRMSEAGLEEARFRTEPEVIAIARGFTRGDRVRPGDRIVALDGSLITTAEGSRKLVELRSGQPVTVRVRRSGEVLDLRLVAGSACALRRQVEEREVEVDRLKESDIDVLPAPPAPPARPGRPAAPAAEAPEAPGAPGALPPMPPMPAVPAPPAPGPSGYLGFGFSCSRCGWRDGGMFFGTPPVVQGLAESGPAARAGLVSGDAIVEVDGLDITSAEGGRRFGAIEPGDRVRLTVRRDGATRVVTVAAVDRPERPAPLPPTGRGASRGLAPAAAELRFEGEVGGTQVEVRGAPVRVTRVEETGEVVIRTSDTVIVLRPGG